MPKLITKKQILELVENKNFSSEEEMENYVFSRIPSLFGVKQKQVERQVNTTNFDGRDSNRADIIIRTDDGFEKAIVVIELKLSRTVNNYNDGDYEDATKQLYKYAQDIRAPYGILLSDIDCHVFENKFFFKDQKYKRINGDALPRINEIEKKMAFNSFMEFILCKYSWKYAILIILFYLLLYFLFIIFNRNFGILISLLMVLPISLLIGSLIGFVLKFKKVLE